MNNKLSKILTKKCHNNYFLSVDDFLMNQNSSCVNSNKKQLKVLQINACSIIKLKKFDSILEFVDSLRSDVHIIVISETWIQSNNLLGYNINNYSNVFSCRDDRIGGGLALYVRKDIEYYVLKVDCGQYPFQFIHIELTRFVRTKLLAVYRLPSSNIECFSNFLETVLSENSKSDNILLGDINIPVNKKDDFVLNYKNLLLSFGLIVTNTNVTRTVSSNILDHVVSSFINIDGVNTSTIYSNISDHNFLFSTFCYSLKYVRRKLEKKSIDFDKVNENFNNFLCSTNLATLDPNSCFTMIINKYNDLIKKFTKIKSVEAKLKNTLCPWITYDIWQLIKKKNKILKKYKSNRSDLLKAQLDNLNKQLNSKKYFAKKHYFNRMFVDLNQKDLWKNINLFLNKNVKSLKLDSICCDGRLLNNSMDIANVFNDYFVKIGSSIGQSINSDRNIFKFNTIQENPNSMYFSSITPTEVFNIICSLNGSNGGGPDNVGNNVVKCRASFFADLLSNIYNEILTTGIYPNCLKIAKVVPVFKSGNSSIINNYRPISTLSVFDKIFEKLIASRLTDFLNNRNFLYSFQYGFRKGSGTELALVEISNMIYNALDGQRFVGALFLDLQKAFDCIDHELLLDKLYCYGIRGVPFNLLKSYLTNRKQYVTINGISGNVLDIECGVPQGSVLGPLLFNIFINDVSYLPLIGQLRIFADDTALFYDTKDPVTISLNIKHDLSVLLEYFKSNLISLNMSKTKFMIFQSPHKILTSVPPLQVCDITIERVNSFKYLGVTLDVNMSWQEHINITCNKIAPLVSLLRKLSWFVPTNVLLKIYFAFIHSRINYGILVYGTACSSRLKKIQIMQNKSLKSIYKLPSLFSTRELFAKDEHLVLPVNILHEFQVAIYMYKTLNISSVLSNLKFDYINHHYITRNSNKLNYHVTKTEYGRKCISYLGPSIYNKIPTNIKISESFLKFKKNLKKYFKSKIELYF